MKSLYLLAYVEMYIKFCSELVNDGKKYIETKTLDANINQNICKKSEHLLITTTSCQCQLKPCS